MSALPLFKIGMLAVRTVSKPVANNLKGYAKNHDRFRRLCAFTGQSWHVFVSKLNIRLLGHKIKQVKPLGEAEAVARGADFFGEFFIYTVSVSAMLLEVWRNDRSNEAKLRAKAQRQQMKEDRARQQLREVNDRIDALWEETSQIRTLLEELREKNEKAASRRWSWF